MFKFQADIFSPDLFLSLNLSWSWILQGGQCLDEDKGMSHQSTAFTLFSVLEPADSIKLKIVLELALIEKSF